MNVRKLSLVLTLAGLLLGCGGMRPTTFYHPQYDFGFVERVALIPFENLTQDRGAASRVDRYFISELLATESFDVVEPGEVSRAIEALGTLRTAQMTREQLKTVGSAVQAQALLLGSVTESATVRTGTATDNVVSIDVRLVETETGETVWSTTHTQKGRGMWSSIFGTGGKSLSEVSRKCVETCVEELVN